nr:MAG TPA: hypothetical protein [Caudoviricetes sp.]
MLTLLAAKEISHREFRGLCHQKQKIRDGIRDLQLFY